MKALKSLRHPKSLTVIVIIVGVIVGVIVGIIVVIVVIVIIVVIVVIIVGIIVTLVTIVGIIAIFVTTITINNIYSQHSQPKCGHWVGLPGRFHQTIGPLQWSYGVALHVVFRKGTLSIYI